MPMNDIEKLVSATRKEHDKTKSAARFFVWTAVFANVVLPILLVVGIVLAFYFLR
jgi:hypothetical protein